MENAQEQRTIEFSITDDASAGPETRVAESNSTDDINVSTEGQ